MTNQSCQEMTRRRYRVGYALSQKKQNRLIKTSLIESCDSKGIELVEIDSAARLIDQGDFDCILHKFYHEDWKKQLEEFQIKNPNLAIIDSVDAIKKLHNRMSMLQVVSELKIESADSSSFGVPDQIVIHDKDTLFDRRSWEFLKFPVIAKPLVADGSDKSHKMVLVFDRDGLNGLSLPIVLQEFVNHGGVIFKVYVVGEFVRSVRRRSLKDVSEEKLKSLEGSFSFSCISNLTNDKDNDNEFCKSKHLSTIEMPPDQFIEEIAKGLRRALNLNLFDFDVIRDTRIGNRYLVIDINYFPGYSKMPGYEDVLTEFFLSVMRERKGESSAGVSLEDDREENDDLQTGFQFFPSHHSASSSSSSKSLQLAEPMKPMSNT